MTQYTQETQNPKWWDTTYDSAWDRVKAAMKRDWEQTKHDLGGKEPDTAQGVSNTVKQAAGKETIPPPGVPTFDEAERAYRFGFGARRKYGAKFNQWDERLESELERDWYDIAPDTDWRRFRGPVRRGWQLEDK